MSENTHDVEIKVSFAILLLLEIGFHNPSLKLQSRLRKHGIL